MIYALVGRSYSGKEAIARYIRKYYSGTVRRFVKYTTNMGAGHKRFSHMPIAQYRALNPEEIFYTTEAGGHMIFAKKSQFTADRDVTYIVDDPMGIDKIDELGIPYVIIYVTSPRDVLLERAVAACTSIQEVKSRYLFTDARMINFKRGGSYNFYVDTSIVSEKTIRTMLDFFLAGVDAWKESHLSALHPPFICEAFGDDWLSRAVSAGFLQAPIEVT